MIEFSDNHRSAQLAAQRFERMTRPDERAGYSRTNLLMDLLAADGVNGNAPLDWRRLLAADDFNFLHDIRGISAHMNRDTGQLGGHFLPRFTVKDRGETLEAAR